MRPFSCPQEIDLESETTSELKRMVLDTTGSRPRQVNNLNEMKVPQSPMSEPKVIMDLTPSSSPSGRRGSKRSTPEANKNSTSTSAVAESTTPTSTSNSKPHRRSSVRRPSTENGSPRDRPVVDHTYTDHFHDPEVFANKNVDKKFASRGGVTTPFPVKLHNMLSSGEDLDDIVGWQPHGRAFLIHDKDVFVNEIMPKFFNQTKLTSFQRQLNLYGFVRLTAPGLDRGSYYHELFLRGRPDLCNLMQRTRIKGNGMKAAASPNTEPRFYQMEHCTDDAVSFTGSSGRKATTGDDMEEDHSVGEEEMGQEEVVEGTGEDASSKVFLDETPALVSPSSSFRGIPSVDGLNENEILLPFFDRSPPKLEGVTPSKYDLYSSQTLSLASLISPPVFQPTWTSLPFEFPPEVDWELGRNDDEMSDCLDLAIMNEEVEDDDLLSISCEGTGIDGQVNKINDTQAASLLDKEEEATTGTMHFSQLTQV